MDKINEINKFISKELWFDFEIKSFDGGTLIIVGGLDLYYNWLIELTFTNVAFVSLKSDWKSNDKLNSLEILSGEKEKLIKILYLIDESYSIFAFNHKDVDANSTNQYLIASDKIEYKINKTQ